jgi:hypothetical protein
MKIIRLDRESRDALPGRPAPRDPRPTPSVRRSDGDSPRPLLRCELHGEIRAASQHLQRTDLVQITLAPERIRTYAEIG